MSPVVAKDQQLEIFDPVRIEPRLVLLLWTPESVWHYTHQMEVREGGREGGRERGREGGRERGRERGIKRGREREGGREGGREGEREGGRERGREGEREGGRERGREGGLERKEISPSALNPVDRESFIFEDFHVKLFLAKTFSSQMEHV